MRPSMCPESLIAALSSSPPSQWRQHPEHREGKGGGFGNKSKLDSVGADRTVCSRRTDLDVA